MEKFNSTPDRQVLATCDIWDQDWDVHQVSAQESTKEYPFFLMYWRDARIPTATVLTHERSSYAIDVEDYKECSLAWKLAADHIEKAQAIQKRNYVHMISKLKEELRLQSRRSSHGFYGRLRIGVILP